MKAFDMLVEGAEPKESRGKSEGILRNPLVQPYRAEDLLLTPPRYNAMTNK